MAAFAERLKEAMELKGLKQADVIRLAQPFGEPVGIRIGKSHMSQYVSGKTEPRRDILKVLAQALEVDAAQAREHGDDEAGKREEEQ
jgi:alanine-synthesizing transaminase